MDNLEQGDDEVINTLPIHYSDAFASQIHLHQFPLLSRPLQVPPSAALSGKRITSRFKPNASRYEIHVPADTRPDLWNSDRAKDYGDALAEGDGERPLEGGGSKLGEVRLRSEPVPHKNTYMLGVVRNGVLCLLPISETHQFRPSLTYLDVMSRKARRSRFHGDSDSDEEGPLDPDESVVVPPVKKEKKPAAEAKEVQVSTRKIEDKAGSQAMQGNLSITGREMMTMIRNEEGESWQSLEYLDTSTGESERTFEAVFSQEGLDTPLQTDSDMTSFLKGIRGL